jgi:hypothetical protein
MTEEQLDEMGPVDYLVVEFPPEHQNFTGEMATELRALVDRGAIRLLDLLVLHKDDTGAVDAFEVDDLDGVDDLRVLETEIAEILAAEDVTHLAEAMDNGSVAGVIVWENTWAAPFASAARRSGGQLIATGRIPLQAIAASMEAEFDELEEELTLRERRSLTCRCDAHDEHAEESSAPVARTAAVVGTAKVVSHGVDRRQGRRQDRRDPRR